MKIIWFKYAFLLVLSAMIFSCTKPDYPADSTSYFTPLSFLSANAPSSQHFTADASLAVSITGAQGTKISFSPSSFVDTQGNVINGNIDIELKELYEKSDIIFANAPTVSGKSLLKSGGMYYIKATQNGKEIFLSKGKSYTAELPFKPNDVRDSNMQIFNGAKYQNRILWQQQKKDTAVSNLGVTSVNESYLMVNDSLHWVNCDAFGNVPTTKITAAIPAGFNDNFTSLFLIVNKYRSVLGMYANAKNVYEVANAPLGEDVTILAVSSINGQMYSAIVSTTTSSNQNISLSLEQIKADDLKTKIKAIK